MFFYKGQAQLSGIIQAMAPPSLTDQLQGWEQWLVKRLFAGRLAKKLYRLYEFKS